LHRCQIMKLSVVIVGIFVAALLSALIWLINSNINHYSRAASNIDFESTTQVLNSCATAIAEFFFSEKKNVDVKSQDIEVFLKELSNKARVRCEIPTNGVNNILLSTILSDGRDLNIRYLIEGGRSIPVATNVVR
jgi:hypothetical protein